MRREPVPEAEPRPAAEAGAKGAAMTVWIARCYHCHRYHIPPRLVARFYPCPRCGTLLLS